MSVGFLLDTNVPSELVRPQPEPRVKAWVATQRLDELFISAVSFGELRRGIMLRAPGKRRTELELWLETDLSMLFSGRILALTRSIAERWGVLDAQRQRMGRPPNVPEGKGSGKGVRSLFDTCRPHPFAEFCPIRPQE